MEGALDETENYIIDTNKDYRDEFLKKY